MGPVAGPGWRVNGWVRGVTIQLEGPDSRCVANDLSFKEGVMLAAALVAHLCAAHSESIPHLLKDVEAQAERFQYPPSGNL